MRYAYVLGDSPSIFLGLRSVSQGAQALKTADLKKNAALLCLNDELPDGDQRAANELLQGWFETRWPQKLQCEL